MTSLKNQKTSTSTPKHRPEIKYIHLRCAPNENEGDNIVVSNMGGATLAYTFVDSLLKDDIVELRFGLACCSYNDNFCKQTGRTIAKHRLAGGPNYWSHVVELSPDDVVQLSQLAIIQHAYEHWPNELAVWGLDADSAEADFLREKETLATPGTRVQI